MLKHGVCETTSTVGRGTVTLAALVGFARVADRFSAGELMDYLLLDVNGNKEWGIGTVGASNSLARTTITGTLINRAYTAGGPAISLSGSATLQCVQHEGSAARIVIDARTATQAATQVLSAITALSGTGGEIIATNGAIAMGASTIVLPEGVVIRGAAIGAGSTYSNSKGTRFHWSGATNKGNCVQIAGHGAGLENLLIDAPTTLAGDIIKTTLTDINFPKLKNLQIVNGPSSSSYYAIRLSDFFYVDASNVVARVACNGFMLEVPTSSFNDGNSTINNWVAYLFQNNRIGWNIASRDNASASGALNILTLNTPQSLCSSGIGSGCIGMRLHGAKLITMVNPDIENHETLIKLDAAGTSNATNNTFVNPYMNASAFTTKNVDCNSNSVGNVFIGGYIATPAAYRGPDKLQDDLTLGYGNPNLYLNVKTNSGFHRTTHQLLRTAYSYGAGISGLVIPMRWNSYNSALSAGMVLSTESTNNGVLSSRSSATHIAGLCQSASPAATGPVDVQINGYANNVMVSSAGNVAVNDNLYIDTRAGQEGRVNNSANLTAVGAAPTANLFFGTALSAGSASARCTATFGLVYRPT